MRNWMLLILLIFARPGSALIELMNRGFSTWLTAIIVSFGAVVPMLILFWLTKISFLDKRVYYSKHLISKTQAIIKKKRFTRNILLSFLSYQGLIKSKREKTVRGIVYSMDKYGGYLVVFLASFIAMPFMRVAAVITARAMSLKGGMYLIIGAATMRCTIDTWIYYHLGETLIPFHLLKFKTILIVNLIILVSGFFGGWLRHAIRDDHFDEGRFS